MWEDVEDYREQTLQISGLLNGHVKIPIREVLDVGCGGGKNSYWLKQDFTVTGLDLSGKMLELFHSLNPECEAVQTDMRDFDLGRQFEGIFVNDSINHMLTRHDLRAVFECCYRHLQPGGVMICGPDYTKETFRQNHTFIDHAHATIKPDNIEITIIENCYDPDEKDDTAEVTLVYLIREDGKLRIESEILPVGVFKLPFWKNTLTEVGFKIVEVTKIVNAEEYLIIVCRKPLDG